MKTLVALVIATGLTVLAVEPSLAFLEWAEAALTDVREHEEHRQQQIQDQVCEMNGTPPEHCPRIDLKPTVIGAAPPSTTTTTTLPPPITLPPL